jgi:glycosyltransferase involved in cell wall biosynthesis
VYLFAPTSQPDRHEAALDATVAMLEREGAFTSPLLMLHGLAHPFAGELASRLGGRGVTRLAMVRRDARAPYPVDADERQALDLVYKTQLSGADLVWAGTRELREELTGINPRTVLHPIGADQGLASGTPAAELAGLPKPLIIYAGSMRAYLNVGLIRGTADRLREASFVFVGPAADFLQPLVAGLRNVHVIGPRPYRLLPDYLAAADVAIAPHQVAPATRAVVPEKLFGYLAAGLPVVTTEIAGAAELRRLVWIARDPSEFARAIQGALKRDRERRRSLRQAAVSPLSWDAIAAHTVASVDAVRAGADLPDPPELKLPAIPGFLAR